MYIMRCQPGTDLELCSLIRAQGVNCVCVTVSRVRRDAKSGRFVTESVPAYPGYLFMDDVVPFETYKGYSGYMRSNDKYIQLSSEAVDTCLTLAAQRGILPNFHRVETKPLGVSLEHRVVNKYTRKGYVVGREPR